MTITIDKLRYPEDMQSYLDLYLSVFGKLESVDFFKWKYIDNPCQTDRESYNIVVAKDGNKLVGARASFPTHIWHNDKPWKAVQAGDTMVHPDYRGQGIFGKMLRFTLEDLCRQNVQLIFNFPNDNSFPGYMKLGWTKQWQVKRHVKLINYVGFMQRKAKKTNKMDTVRSQEVSDWSYKGLNISTDAPDAAEKLFRGIFKGDMYTAQYRTLAWLNWRYVMCPKKKYWFISLEQEGALKGYAVVSLTRSGAGELIDYLVEGHDPIILSRLVKGAISWFKVNNATDMRAWCAHPRFAKVFVGNMFLPLRQRLYFVTRSLDENWLNSASWYINMGDTDTY